MTPVRILFVDDDVNVLVGLRDNLRRRRKDWEMVFVDSGTHALERLNESAFDIIVADLIMPGMDGIALLDIVRNLHPGVSRMVLTSQSEHEQLVLASKVTHQLLCKPCEGALLQLALEQMIDARKLASRPDIRETVGRVSSLPAMDTVFREMMIASEDPDCRMDAIAAILERDPGLSVRVMQMANSALHGRLMKLRSVGEAIDFLGLNLVRGLLLSVQVVHLLEQSEDIACFDASAWQAHAQASAKLARLLCFDRNKQGEAFIAGLLHDVGSLVFVLGRPEDYAQVLRLRDQQGGNLVDLEKQVMGICHDEVGAYFLACLGISPSIVSAVAKHHLVNGDAPSGQQLEDTDAMAYAVWAANEVHDLFGHGADDSQVQHWLDQQAPVIGSRTDLLEELLLILEISKDKSVSNGHP